jgi:2-polyprenyl-3-methyl-5-hydroxy-6-metoxy-1,4-benzoquinol methylase
MENERMNKAEKFWDKMADRSDMQAQKGEQTYLNTVDYIKQYFNRSDIILDYACGTGLFSHELANHVKEIHALDISSKMLEIAKRIAGERNIENIKFIQSTIFDESYSKETFDVVMAFNILHLLEDTQEVIQRINELLKPGGVLISETACLGEKKVFFSILLTPLRKIGIFPYANLLKISELEEFITTGNFQIIESKKLDHSPPMSQFIIARKK